jgi:hypothetical protein
VLIWFFPNDIFQRQKSGEVFVDRGRNRARAMVRSGSEVSSTAK